MRREVREASPGGGKEKIHGVIGNGDHLASLYPTTLTIQLLQPSNPQPFHFFVLKDKEEEPSCPILVSAERDPPPA